MGSLYADDMVNHAREWIGYHEGSNNWTIFAKILDECNYFAPQKKQNTAWCTIFPDCMCLISALPKDRDDEAKKYDAQYFLYQPSYNNYSAGAREMADYFKNAGAWYDEPQFGDIVFFYVDGKIGHAGIVEDTDGCVTSIEGNAGDQVQRKWYDFDDSKIAGYGRPRYDGLFNPENINHEPVDESAPVDEPLPCGEEYEVKVNSYLSIRTEPFVPDNPDENEIGRLFNGAKVIVYEQDKGWGRIGSNLWVCMDYLF